MKKNIHPTLHPAIFVDTSCGKEFIATSTRASTETRTIGDVVYHVHNIEISSASHPFYTGKQVLVDSARRAEKFQERVAKTSGVAATRKGKKVKRVKAATKKKAEKAAEKESEKTETK